VQEHHAMVSIVWHAFWRARRAVPRRAKRPSCIEATCGDRRWFSRPPTSRYPSKN